MKIDIIEISGFASALAGLRKPFKGQINSTVDFNYWFDKEKYIFQNESDIVLNKSDYKLMLKLVKAGDEHAKCIRGIRVTLDISAPRYFWSEHDTYRVGVDSLSSESTMHTILKDDINEECFDAGTSKGMIASFNMDLLVIKELLDNKTISKNDGTLKVKQILPESFIQTRTIQYSYQALRRIYFQRKNHRLPIWKEFCRFIETLPMSELITGKNE